MNVTTEATFSGGDGFPRAQPRRVSRFGGSHLSTSGFNRSIKFAENGFSEKTAWHPCVESFGKGHGIARIPDVIVANVGGNESGLDHPAVFPLALAEQLIKTFSQEGISSWTASVGAGRRSWLRRDVVVDIWGSNGRRSTSRSPWGGCDDECDQIAGFSAKVSRRGEAQ